MTVKQLSTNKVSPVNPGYLCSVAITLQTEIESGRVFVVLSRLHSGTSSNYVNGQPKQVGSCDIDDRESIYAMRLGLEEDFLTLAREVLE